MHEASPLPTASVKEGGGGLERVEAPGRTVQEGVGERKREREGHKRHYEDSCVEQKPEPGHCSAVEYKERQHACGVKRRAVCIKLGTSMWVGFRVGEGKPSQRSFWHACPKVAFF